jgi:hypothetical protein
MIVAMAAVRMVQMAIDEIIDMIGVWDALVSAARSMDVMRVMLATRMRRCAGRPVRRADFKDVFINVIAMHMVQVTVVQVIDMAVVLQGDMAATRGMCVGVILVFGASHTRSFQRCRIGSQPCESSQAVGDDGAGARVRQARQWTAN